MARGEKAMSARALIILGWTLAAVTTVLSLGAIVHILMTLDQPFLAGFAFRGYDVISGVTLAGVGALIVSRRPTHPVGWLLLASGLLSGLQTVADQFATF